MREQPPARPWTAARPVAALLGSALLVPNLCAALQTVEPRAFGYSVGDVLERRVLLDPLQDGRVDPASLPKPGRVGRWFALRAVTPLPRDQGWRLTYQWVNVPDRIDQQNLPALNLRLIGTDGRARDASIGPFTVGIAPVVRFGPADTVQLEDLRPDRQPQAGDPVTSGRRAVACSIGLLLVLMAWAAPALARRLGWRWAGPFAQARRALRRLSRRGDDAQVRLQAMRQLHGALDRTAGMTVTLDNLESLFAARPWLEPARDSIRQLLQASRGTFFGPSEVPRWSELTALATRWAELEAGR